MTTPEPSPSVSVSVSRELTAEMDAVNTRLGGTLYQHRNGRVYLETGRGSPLFPRRAGDTLHAAGGGPGAVEVTDDIDAGEPAVQYLDILTGKGYALPARLFDDGRFQPLTLTQPQPEAPAPANPLAGWTDLHVAGDWLAGRPPGAQAVRAIAQVSAPAPALPAEVREVLLLVAEFVGAHHDYMMSDDDNDSLFWHLAVQEAKLRELNPTRLRALAGAEAQQKGGA